MYPFLQRILHMAGVLILMALVVILFALSRQMNSGTQGVYTDIEAQTGLQLIADAIVPLQENEPGSLDLNEWQACRGEFSEKAVVSIAGKLRSIDQHLRSSLTNAQGVAPRPHRLDLVRLNELLLQATSRPFEVKSSIDEKTSTWRFRCKSFYKTLAAMRLDREGNDLGRLLWKEITPRKVGATSAFDGKPHYAMFDSRKIRANPWRPLDGCVLMQSERGYVVLPPHHNERVAATLCTPALDALSQAASSQTTSAEASDAVSRYRRAKLAGEVLPIPTTSFRIAGDSENDGNQIKILGNDVPQSSHVVTTIRPEAQRALQSVLNCYTGTLSACHEGQPVAAGATPSAFYEGAAVRMAGALLLDIQTGEIVAAASAESPCFRLDNSGAQRDLSRCPELPSAPAYSPQMLENHALYFEYHPGSIIKPLMALGILGDPSFPASRRAQMASAIGRSDSGWFLDQFLCEDKGFKACTRHASAFKIADRLGWNTNCLDDPGACGQYGLLHGGSRSPESSDSEVKSEAMHYFSGRWGIHPAAGTNPPFYVTGAYSPTRARECSKGDGPGERKWYLAPGATRRGCGEETLNLLRNFGVGQGESWVSPLGVAMLWAHLGNVDSGRTSVTTPHLYRQGFVVNDGRAEFTTPALQISRSPLDPQAVEIIVDGMVESSMGTARGDCAAVFGGAACKNLPWIAGKTGTPGTSRSLTDPKWLHACGRPEKRKETAAQVSVDSASVDGIEDLGPESVRNAAQCAYQPVRWYAALVGDSAKSDEGSGGQRNWKYALVVVVQRNWLRSSGSLPNTNFAAQIAFRYLRNYQQQALNNAELAASGGVMK